MFTVRAVCQQFGKSRRGLVSPRVREVGRNASQLHRPQSPESMSSYFEFSGVRKPHGFRTSVANFLKPVPLDCSRGSTYERRSNSKPWNRRAPSRFGQPVAWRASAGWDPCCLFRKLQTCACPGNYFQKSSCTRTCFSSGRSLNASQNFGIAEVKLTPLPTKIFIKRNASISRNVVSTATE